MSAIHHKFEVRHNIVNRDASIESVLVHSQSDTVFCRFNAFLKTNCHRNEPLDVHVFKKQLSFISLLCFAKESIEQVFVFKWFCRVNNMLKKIEFSPQLSTELMMWRVPELCAN